MSRIAAACAAAAAALDLHFYDTTLLVRFTTKKLEICIEEAAAASGVGCQKKPEVSASFP